MSLWDLSRKVQNHPVYRVLVPVGLVAYGVVYGILGYLAVAIAVRGPLSGGKVSLPAAMLTIAQRPLGTVLLIAAAAGMFVLVVWQLIEAAFGYVHLGGLRRFNRRVASLGRAIIYLGVAVLALTVALRIRQPAYRYATWTEVAAAVMDVRYGRIALFAVGVFMIAVGVGQIGRGVGKIFVDEFVGEVPRWIVILGMISYGMLGLSLVLVGFGCCWAALWSNPHWAGSLNHTAHLLASRPAGAAALILIGAGPGLCASPCSAWRGRAGRSTHWATPPRWPSLRRGDLCG